jgi:hypothetical protein
MQPQFPAEPASQSKDPERAPLTDSDQQSSFAKSGSISAGSRRSAAIAPGRLQVQLYRRAAKALGLTVPPSLLAGADEAIE